MRAMEIITIAAGIIAALLWIGSIGSANGAPQEAAASAMSLTIAAIPYFITATMQRSRLLKHHTHD